MKKLFALLAAMLLAFTHAALAEPLTDESAPLTHEELTLFLDALSNAAREEGSVPVVSEWEFLPPTVAFSGGQLDISDETFDESTAVVGATLNEEQEDPRGIRLGDSLEDVLRAYPNDNPHLTGSYFDAALYVAGEKPEMTVGYLLRVGQQVVSVYHEVYSWRPEGVAVSSVTYLFDQGAVAHIFVALDSQILEEELALSDIHDVSDMQEFSDFTPYPQSAENGEALAPFEREDLTLTQLGQRVGDFLDLTAEDLTAVLGQAPVDEWTEDSNGAFLRLLQWDGVSLLLNFDAERHFLGVDSLTVNDAVLDGPRGVRVGDTLDSVLFRFRHGDVFLSDDTIALYGDGGDAPYGVLAYTPESAEVTYALALEDDGAVIWHLTFVAGHLETMTLLRR